MKVILESTYGDLNFKGTNERGQIIQFSGNKEAVGPMESVLMAAAACSAIDVETILKKMRQEVKSVKVEIEGIRAEAVPAVFTKIHMHYIINGDIKQEKAKIRIPKDTFSKFVFTRSTLSFSKYKPITPFSSSTADLISLILSSE